MTMRSAIYILAILCAMPAWGGVIPDSERKTLLQKTLSSWFWGQARLRDGSFVQPENEKDKKTMPISAGIANQVLDVGEISGYAEWCGLDWQSHFLSMTASARKAGLKEKQLAFIGVIHGLAQGIVFDALKTKHCGDRERSRVSEMMNNNLNKRF